MIRFQFLLVLGCTAGCSTRPPPLAPTVRADGLVMRAVLFGPDLQDDRLNGEASLDLMRGALEARGVQVVEDLRGDEANEGRLLAAIRGAFSDLREPSLGRLVVYGIAHGGYQVDRDGIGHPAVLLDGGAEVLVSELREEVDAAGGQALVLDACMVGPASLPTWSSPESFDSALLAAAEPGKPARADEVVGGEFTAALVRGLDRRGGLFAAMAEARRELAEKASGPTAQLPTTHPGRLATELTFTDTGSDPPILLDGLSPLLRGTGVALEVDGQPMSNAGLVVVDGDVTLTLSRDGRPAGGAWSRRHVQPGTPLLLVPPSTLEGLSPAEWLMPLAAEADRRPTLTAEPVPVDCATVEDLIQVDLDEDREDVELFLTCAGPTDHPRWLVADGGSFKDRSASLHLDQLGPGGFPAALSPGVCYVAGPGDVGQPGPLACVGRASPRGRFVAPPVEADFDEDGELELLLFGAEGLTIEDGTRRTPVGGGPVTWALPLRLDGDTRVDLLRLVEGTPVALLNLRGGWASLKLPRVPEASDHASLLGTSRKVWDLVSPSNARGSAIILPGVPGLPVLGIPVEVGGGARERYRWIGADLDMDGRVDLIGFRPGVALLARDRGWDEIPFGDDFKTILPVDIDGDGDLDLLGLTEAARGLQLLRNDLASRRLVEVKLDPSVPATTELTLVAGPRNQRMRLDGTRGLIRFGVGEQEPDRLQVTWPDGTGTSLPARDFARTDRGWQVRVGFAQESGDVLLVGRLRVDLDQHPPEIRTLAALDGLAVDWARNVGRATAVLATHPDGTAELVWLDRHGSATKRYGLPAGVNFPSVLNDRLLARDEEGLIALDQDGWRRIPLATRAIREVAEAFGETWVASRRQLITAMRDGVLVADRTLPCPQEPCVDREILRPTPDGRSLFVIDTWRPAVEVWTNGVHQRTLLEPEIRRPEADDSSRWDPYDNRLLLPVQGGLDSLTPGETISITRPRQILDDHSVDAVLALPGGKIVTLETQAGMDPRLVLLDELSGAEVQIPLPDPGGRTLAILSQGVQAP